MERVSLNKELKDGDIVTYSFPIHGEATVRRSGKIWRVHKNDKDSIISDFHAHNIEDMREVLDLYTAYIHRSHTKQVIGKLSDKDYIAVLTDLSHDKEEVINKKAHKILNNL